MAEVCVCVRSSVACCSTWDGNAPSDPTVTERSAPLNSRLTRRLGKATVGPCRPGSALRPQCPRPPAAACGAAGSRTPRGGDSKGPGPSRARGPLYVPSYCAPPCWRHGLAAHRPRRRAHRQCTNAELCLRMTTTDASRDQWHRWQRRPSDANITSVGCGVVVVSQLAVRTRLRQPRARPQGVTVASSTAARVVARTWRPVQRLEAQWQRATAMRQQLPCGSKSRKFAGAKRTLSNICTTSQCPQAAATSSGVRPGQPQAVGGKRMAWQGCGLEATALTTGSEQRRKQAWLHCRVLVHTGTDQSLDNGRVAGRSRPMNGGAGQACPHAIGPQRGAPPCEAGLRKNPF